MTIKRLSYFLTIPAILAGVALCSAPVAAAPTITEYPISTPYAQANSLTTGPDGALWFTENYPNSIGRMTTGGVITEYSIPTASSQPRSIAAGSDGALWFTESAGTAGTSKIGRITTSGVITEYAVPTNSAGPQYIVAGPDGALWFTEWGGDKIGRITTTGDITEYHIPSVSHPEAAGITVGADGALWFAEYGNNKIGRITTTGNLTEYALPASLNYPRDITAGPDGALWFSSAELSSIGRITTDGSVTAFSTSASGGIQGIAAGPDGALWFTDGVNNKVGRMTTSGVVTTTTVPTAQSTPFAITSGPGGALWFTEWGGNKIGRLVPDNSIPTNFAISSGDSVPVQLTWSAVPGAQYYVVYRNGVKVNESFPASFLDRSAHTGSNTYYVTAVTANGESDPSNTATMTAPIQRHVTGVLSINGQSLPTTPYSNASMQLMDSGGTSRTGTNAVGTSSYDINDTGIFSGRYGIRYQYNNSSPQLDTRTSILPSQFLLKEIGTPVEYFFNDNAENLDFTTKRLNVVVRDAHDNPISSQVVISNTGGDSTITNNAAQTTYTVVSGFEHSESRSDSAGATSFALFPGSDFIVCATTINVCRTIPFNDDATVVLSPLAPAPANLAVTSPTVTPALSWAAVSGATSYNVYRDGTKIGSSTTLAYTDSAASEGTHAYGVATVNAAGEGSQSGSVSVVVDHTVPTITYDITPVANTDGNNTGNVTVTFHCDDALSGVATCSSPTTVGDEGVGHTVTGVATDKAGNTTTINASASLLAQAINAGGGAAGDFSADKDFAGGTSYTSTVAVDTSSVTVPAPQAVYQSSRYGNTMDYTLSSLTPNGHYTLDFNFNELYWGTSLAGGGAGSRVFNVAVNGQSALSNFDIYQTAGGANRALNEQVPVTADANGVISIHFTTVTDNALVSGITLYNGTLPPQAPPPAPTPVTSALINAGGIATGDFAADSNFLGGTPYTSTTLVDTSGVTTPAPQAVYQSTRYGNFTYTIPNLTPNTNFLARLHFNELYWGTPLAGNAGGNGSRVFNVAINGSQVLSNFDIYQTAGGANRALVREFATSSDAQGKVAIQFTTVVDNALISGIEVVPVANP